MLSSRESLQRRETTLPSFGLAFCMPILPEKIEMQKDSDGRLIIIPPRLNGLRIKQQSFRQYLYELYSTNSYNLKAQAARNKKFGDSNRIVSLFYTNSDLELV